MRVPLTGMLTFDDFTSDDVDSNSLEEWDVDDDLFEDDYDGLDCVIGEDTLCFNNEEDELSFVEEVYKDEEDFDGLYEEAIAIALAIGEDIGLERKNNFMAARAKTRVSIEDNRDCFPRTKESKLRPFEAYVRKQLYGD